MHFLKNGGLWTRPGYLKPPTTQFTDKKKEQNNFQIRMPKLLAIIYSPEEALNLHMQERKS
jgi:hypothetical protein